MADVAYTSKVRIVRERGPLRTAMLPGRADPVTFGVHGDIAAHYGVDPDDFPPDATTIDYLVAAAGG
ncbi:hypothetical protein [Nitriliruptor alkaliphilus]|uniref:hypothetical protein n=1 Tax=Nitriliruptor alkaliphilus TaxID=427918 RepID=UPI0006986216|nr:hypothetical protein [Nitriliruptor alkaliphilus]